MDDKKLLFIYNPRAGKGQIRAKFFGVEGEAAPFVHKRGASPSHHLFMVS